MKPPQTLIATFSFVLVSCIFVFPAQAATPLDPASIPQWVNQLTGPLPVYVPINVTDNLGSVIRQEYKVNITQFTQQLLPTQDASGKPTGFGATTVWGYGGLAMDPASGQYLGYIRSTPGPTFEAIRNVPIQVKWVNDLLDTQGNPLQSLFAVDPTIHWANPNGMAMASGGTAPGYPPGFPDAQSPVPIVTHLHGGEVSSADDGNPDAWFTATGDHGPAYNTAAPTDSNADIYAYPNTQQPTTLWYHDHTLGMTRLNILSGLVGFYLLRDPADPVAPLLPTGQFDIPLAVQDRTFLSDGSLYYPSVGNNPDVHPYWNDAFLGNTIMVNGLVWPNLNVEQGLYRFRLLDASNSRFYEFKLSNGMNFTQIGTDGGYLKTAASVNSLLMGPAERTDILVDFSNLPAGTKVILQNTAVIGSGEKATVGQIMQFTVTGAEGVTAKTLPTELNPTLTGSWPTLQNVTKQRTLSLIEAVGTNGTLAMYLDGQSWDEPVSEEPTLGTTEEWTILNPTTSAHTIHLHLVQFQVVNRQTFNDTRYNADWFALNGQPPLNHTTLNLPSLTPYLTGDSVPAAANEQGWKDTVQAFAGQVTVIRVRFAQQDGSSFPFDATSGPVYVWHCHLLEHEDNEMMRPYTLASAASSAPTLPLGTVIVVVAAVVVVAAGLVAVAAWRLGVQQHKKRAANASFGKADIPGDHE
jgi:spore coat protein A, manganese oxidase